mgnify:CR=1 FL=1
MMTASLNLGKVHVITGPGKGKTTAAFGLALRAAGHGIKVCIVQFMKTGETTGEAISVKNVPGIELVQFGTGRFVDPKRVEPEDRECAGRALARAREVVEGRRCGLLVLDEVNVATAFGLVGSDEVLDLLETARDAGIETVLTGRNAPLEFIEYADYVSVTDSWKHPFDSEGGPRKGIEW